MILKVLHFSPNKRLVGGGEEGCVLNVPFIFMFPVFASYSLPCRIEKGFLFISHCKPVFFKGHLGFHREFPDTVGKGSQQAPGPARARGAGFDLFA